MNTKYDITKDKHYEVLKNFVRYSKDGTVRPPYSEITLNTYITNYNKFRKLNEGPEPVLLRRIQH